MTKELNFFDCLETSSKKVVPPLKEAPTPDPLDVARLVQLLDTAKDKKEKEEIDSQQKQVVKRVIEALFFSSSEPLSLCKIREVTDTIHPFKPRVLIALIYELRDEYLSEKRSFRLEEMNESYVLRTLEEYGPYVAELYRSKRGEKLSHAASEVLAIIAYRQPVTRPNIDAIRGVDSSGTLHALLERGLVEIVGRFDGPGRPSLYAVTSQFMQYYGLRDLTDLPSMESISDPVVAK